MVAVVEAMAGMSAAVGEGSGGGGRKIRSAVEGRKEVE
jgi:hypothetical protein